MQLFYTPEIQPEQQVYQLSLEESKHAIRVLRMHAGDQVSLIDGRGGFFQAEIAEAHPKRTQLRILSYTPDYGRSPYRLHIAIAPTKSMDRLEWFLEKGTEIGLHEVTPLLVDHSERKEVKLDRLNKIVVAASKQSLKAFVPRVNPMISLRQFLDQLPDQPTMNKGIAHCKPGEEKQYMNQKFRPGMEYLMLIGPEGDFTSQEIALAFDHGFTPISLGDFRLRTETAAVFACAEAALLNR